MMTLHCPSLYLYLYLFAISLFSCVAVPRRRAWACSPACRATRAWSRLGRAARRCGWRTPCWPRACSSSWPCCPPACRSCRRRAISTPVLGSLARWLPGQGCSGAALLAFHAVVTVQFAGSAWVIVDNHRKIVCALPACALRRAVAAALGLGAASRAADALRPERVYCARNADLIVPQHSR